jgi:hypothetical protein
MAGDYVAFQRFNDKALAEELGELLKQHNIDYLLEDASAKFDVSFAFNELTKVYWIKLKKEDFEAAGKLLLQVSAKELENLPADYYLYEFSDDELREIINKPDEWNELDYLLAQKLLKERGKEVRPDEIEMVKKQRMEDLSKPEKSSPGWIVAGYIFAFLGGLIGLVIGWVLYTHKKILPNGERIYAYSENDRKNGRNILIIGIICFLISVGSQIISD